MMDTPEADGPGVTDTTADESVGDALGNPGAEIEGHLEATVIEPEEVSIAGQGGAAFDAIGEEPPATPERPLTPEQALNAVRPDAQ